MIIFAIFGLLLICFLGWLYTSLIKPKASLFEKVSLSYLLGIGMFTFILFILNILGLKYTTFNTVIIYICLIVFALFVNKKLHFIKFKNLKLIVRSLIKKYKSLSKIDRISITLLGVILMWVVIYSCYWPVKDWDSIVLYDFRARMFLINGFMDTSIPESYLYGYPLLTSLAHMLIYMTGFQYPGIVHSLFFVSFVIIFFALVKSKMSLSLAIFWTLIFSLSSNLIDHAYMTYTNLAYVVYLVSGLFYMFEWVNGRNKSDLILASLLVGLSTWTRSAEPFWMIPIAMVVLVSIKEKKWLQIIWFSIIVKSFSKIWELYVKREMSIVAKSVTTVTKSSSAVPFNISEALNIQRLFEVGNYYFVNSILPSWPQYLNLFFVSVILFINYKHHKKINSIHLIILMFIIICLGVSIGGVFIFSLTFSEWKSIGGSLTRMMLFLGPLTLYISALVVSETFESNEKIWKKYFK